MGAAAPTSPTLTMALQCSSILVNVPKQMLVNLHFDFILFDNTQFENNPCIRNEKNEQLFALDFLFRRRKYDIDFTEFLS